MRGSAGKTVRRCCQAIYKQVEQEKHKEKYGVSPLAKIVNNKVKKTRWNSGYCKICGEYMQIITHLHAAEHGYNSAEEFIEKGNVIFD